VTINNQAGGTIEGGGATAAAIQTGADNDTINNAGSIIADSSGKAIDMGAGNNALKITGGVASITGNVSGGTGGTNTLTIDPGTGNKFSYSGVFSNFNSAEIKSGTVVLSGANTYAGNTLVSGGNLVANSTAGSSTGTGQVTVNAGATLSGAGKITPASGKSVLINGILSVGDPTLVSPTAGALSITTTGGGAIVLGANSELHFDLFSGAGAGDNSSNLSSADRLIIGGNFTVNSTAKLFIDNPNSMTAWAIGDVWQVFDLASLGTLTGSFGSANISLPSLSAGEKWDTDSLLTNGRLSIVSAAEAGPGLAVLALGLVGMAALRRRSVTVRALQTI
jgi:autotransporter-associated beta strand protein